VEDRVRGCYWAPTGVGIRRAAEERVGGGSGKRGLGVEF